MTKNNEIFKPIQGYEDTYYISNYGRVKNIKKGIFLKGNPNTYGYLRAVLSNNIKTKWVSIHRLVGLHFIDGYFDGAEINHKDGNKSNNHFSNLEWTTRSENVKHCWDNKLRSYNYNATSKKVINTLTGEVYLSMSLASKNTGICNSHLKRMLQGKRNNHTNLKILK